MTKRKDDVPNQGTQKVGYGRPPEHTRFKPGQSGNPGGRPKKRKPKIYNMQELEKLIVATGNQTVKIMKDGKPMDITMIQEIFEQVHRKAIQGDQRSIKMVIDMQMKTFASVDAARLKMAENLQASRVLWLQHPDLSVAFTSMHASFRVEVQSEKRPRAIAGGAVFRI